MEQEKCKKIHILGSEPSDWTTNKSLAIASNKLLYYDLSDRPSMSMWGCGYARLGRGQSSTCGFFSKVALLYWKVPPGAHYLARFSGMGCGSKIVNFKP